MPLHGKNFIGQSLSAEGKSTFAAINPATGAPLDTSFHNATQSEIERALELAATAFSSHRRNPRRTP